MFKRAVIMLMLVGLPAGAMAGTYKWVNERGVVNFTDDPDNIPKRYRSSAVVIDNSDQAVEVTETTQSAPVPAQSKKEKEQEKSPDNVRKAKAMYGEKDEDTWRRDFAKLKGDIRAYEENLGAMKSRLADTSRMSRAEYLSLQSSIKNSEVLLNKLRGQLEALQSEADKAGVPNDLR